VVAPIVRRWPGATLVCLAPGPSLTAEAVADVSRAGVPVVAVNDTVRLAPWAEVLYSSDRAWWRYYDGVPKFGGRRVGIGRHTGDASPIRVPSGMRIHVLEHTGPTGLDPAPTGLRSGSNSGYAAVNLAVHLGAARILLVGYTLGTHAGRGHFFGSHPRGLAESREEHYAAFRRAFGTLIAPLAALGVEVLNCTPDTHLAAFPRVDLADALAAEVGAR